MSTSSQTEKHQAAPAEEAPRTVAQLKKHVCEKLTQIFSSKLMNERLMRMVGGDASRIAKNLTSFLAVITQDEGSGQPKKFFYQCTLSSLTMCFLESMNMQLPFDSRKLVSMIIYDWEAELDISYKGFVNALSRHYQNAYVDAKLVFDDDEFECEETGGKAVFHHKSANAFRTVSPAFASVAGAYCYFSYTLQNGEPVSRMMRMSREDILKIRSKARTKNVWDEFPSEMGLKAVIRRAAKIPFASIDLDADIEDADNKHYLLDKPDGGNRLKALMHAQEEVVSGKPAPAPAPPAAQVEERGAGEAVEDTARAAPGEKSMYPDEAEKAEISDADFDDRQEPESYNPGERTPGGAEEVLPKRDPNGWDGKTVYVGDGKSAVRDFPTAAAALIYVKKVLSQRTHKATRKEIFDSNKKLTEAVLADGGEALLAEVRKIIDQGA